MDGFIGRYDELQALEREFAAARPSLVIVYGRRRVGKSTLLQKAASDGGTAIYFQATTVDAGMNLKAFADEIVRVTGPDPIVENASDWLTILHRLAEIAEGRRNLRVVIDEFPYLLDGAQSLPSILQKFWDSGAAGKGNLNLVLCGSMIAHMEDLLAERNPLYGRRTLSIELGPMPLREAAEFLPGYSAEDCIQAYSIFGGIPYYLRQFNPGETLRDNVCRLVMDQMAPLLHEPEFLLRSELKEIGRYASIVAAIAEGQTKLGDIVGRISGVERGADLSPYLEHLSRMRIIERIRSLDAPPRARDTRYVLADPFFRFWYRYVAPNASAIARGFGREVYKRVVQPNLSEFMGPAFEDVCREHLRLFAQEATGIPAGEIGKIWSGDYDIDVAGTLLDSCAIYGECKWTNAPIDGRIYRSFLADLAKSPFAAKNSDRWLVLFSKSGYTPEVQAVAEDGGLLLLHPDDIAFWPQPELDLEHDDANDPTPDSRLQTVVGRTGP